MIFGMEVQEGLDDGCVAIDAVAVVKYLNEKGDPEILVTSTPTLSAWECYGFLAIAAKMQEQEVLGNFEEGDDDAR